MSGFQELLEPRSGRHAMELRQQFTNWANLKPPAQLNQGSLIKEELRAGLASSDSSRGMRNPEEATP
jgi:hypothetical protein